MSSTDATARRRAELPASIIFSPKELKHYRRWQLQTQSYYDFDSLGHLPSALEYCAFRAWRKDQQRVDAFPDPFRWSEELAAHISPPVTPHSAPLSPPLSEFDFCALATACGHLLHPAAPVGQITRCPPCLIDAHLQYMQDLTDRLDSVGAPALHPPTQDMFNPQQLTYEAWYSGKLDLVQTVYMMEEWSAEERAWRSQSSADVPRNKKIRSAQEALMIYWATIDNAIVDVYYEQTLDGSSAERRDSKMKRRDSGREKAVGFAKDTCFNEGRAQAYFRKDGPRYDSQEEVLVEDNSEQDQESETEDERKIEVKKSRPDMAHRRNATTTGDWAQSELEESSDDETVDSDQDSSEDEDEEDDEIEWEEIAHEEPDHDTSFIVFGE